EWLSSYPYQNVFVFDFYNVLTTNGGTPLVNDLGRSDGNHHRWWNNEVQHKTDGDHDANPNITEYASGFGDDHPNRQGNLKATGEFVPLLNVAYNRWKNSGGSSSTTTTITSTTSTIPEDGGDGEPCIAEKIYGSSSKATRRLRQYRDEVMVRATHGGIAIRLYYGVVSPVAGTLLSRLL
ncbi:MAG: hypothetical protein N3F66_14700, partial [Spirochaetes bacterium]|nr:hypothetical protein [Spirochaetota bacterium]